MIAVLDVETTGTADWSRVVEVGAVVLDERYEEIAQFSSLCCPDILDERAERALAYNGITMDDVCAAPPSAEVAESFDRWLVANGVTEVWAYSRGFDRRMLDLSGFTGIPWHPDGGSILALAREQMPWRPKDPPLADAAEHFLGARPEAAHRALGDARTAARVLACIRRM